MKKKYVSVRSFEWKRKNVGGKMSSCGLNSENRTRSDYIDIFFWSRKQGKINL
jgi:hypothetical protein